MKYNHHKYTWMPRWKSVYHNWEFVGPFGGVNFHVSLLDGARNEHGQAGIEFHHTARCGLDARAPDHINCPLVGGNCWHDGSSLFAAETLWPRYMQSLEHGDHAAIFRDLERVADQHFAEYETADND